MTAKRTSKRQPVPTGAIALEVPLTAEAALEGMADGIVVLDEEWQFVYGNSAYEAILAPLGRTLPDLMGKVIWKEFPDLVGTPFYSETVRAREEGRPTQYTEHYAPLDAWFEIRAFPVAGGVVIVARNVTDEVTTRRTLEERTALVRASEARYRALVEVTAQMVWRTNPVGEFQVEQPEWEAYTGQTFEEYRGTGWVDAVHPADRGRTLVDWQRALANRSMCQLEYRIRNRTGEYRWFQVRAAPVFDADGKIAEWVGTEADIEEEVRRRASDHLLAEVGVLVASGLDSGDAGLTALARMVVGTGDARGIADGCMITLVDPATELPFNQIAVVSVDPHAERMAREMMGKYSPPADLPYGFPAVIRTGRSEVIAPGEMQDVVLPAMASDDRMLAMTREMGVYSGLCVPLSTRGRTFGAMTWVLHGPDRRPAFDSTALRTAEELGRRIALALDNRRLVAELRETNSQLTEANSQLQDQAVEMEAQAEELQATATQLEERTELAEEAQREAESVWQQLVNTFSQAPIAVAVVQGDFYSLVNERFVSMTGGRAAVGRRLRESFASDEATRIFKVIESVYDTGRPATVDEVAITVPSTGKRVDERLFDISFEPLRAASREIYAVAIVAVDVTVQVRAREAAAEGERSLRTLADAIPTLAWTARADGFIDWYNARWYEYTGTTPEQMAGWGWQSVHDPEVLPEVLRRWRSSIATGEPFEMTFPLLGADGRFRQFLTRVSPLKDAHGRVTRWFGTNTDVEIEREARAAAERANQAKMDFLATMSHELRTPLNAIAGYADLLEMGIHGVLNDEQRNAVSRVRRSQRHLLGLINDVLNFAKLEAGQVEYDIASIPLREALDTLDPLVTPQLQAKGLRYERKLADPAVAVRADADKLRQILVNLMSNAIKFTPHGGTISIECEVEGATVSIAVRDTGIGIAPDRHEEIFGPFVQVDRKLHTPGEGTGLGLAISRDLARAMGGDIVVDSAIDQGAVFTVTLPVAD